VNKLFIGIILITALALSACEPMPTGTGGYDPETQTLLAIATQTGAANLIAQTEAAKAATQQSIYAQQTAVSYNATSTMQAEVQATQAAQAQATAVSATETMVHMPVSAIQTTDAQTVLMERENAASTATAVAISAEIVSNQKTAARMDKFWQGFMLFLGGLGIALVIGTVNLALRFHKPVPPVFSDDGIAQAVDSRFYQLTNNIRPSYREPVLIDQPKEKPMFTAPTPTTNTRTMPGHKNGRPHEWELPEENPVPDETWVKLAVALLVCRVNFSRDDVLDKTKRNWVYGRMSQPEYNGAYEFMRLKGWVGGHMGQEKMTAALYEFLEDYVPTNEEIALPHPDEAEIIEGR